MEPFDNNNPQDYQPQPSEHPAPEPQDTTYHIPGPQRRESPYANSPYEMHQNHSEYHYQPQPPQPPKQRKPRKPIWKGVLACLLAAVLVAGGCMITATAVNSNWEKRSAESERELSQKIEQLEKQISGGNLSNGIQTLPNDGSALSPSQLYAGSRDSVVAIASTVQTSSLYGPATGTSSGSGFIWSEDGYVVTNYHVIQNATDVQVISYDNMEYPAAIVGYDAANDIAVLKVEAEGLSAAPIGSSAQMNIGDMVAAIGNPLGSGATIEGIGFASPIDDVVPIINALIEYGYVTGAYMGVTAMDTDAESAAKFGLPTGAYIVSVEEGGAAAKAGIQPKDIVIDLGGTTIRNRTDLTRALRNYKAGDTTTVTVIRSGKEVALEITLDEKPQEAQPTVPQPDENMPSEGSYDEWFDWFFGGRGR